MTVELFNKNVSESHLMSALVQHIPEEYRPVSCHGSELKFHGENKPSEAVLAIARQKAIENINQNEIFTEGQRRIIKVTPNWGTQINLLMWCFQHLNTDNADMHIARSIFAWISETKETVNKLVNDPTYRDDRHWPKVPDGALDFIKRNG